MSRHCRVSGKAEVSLMHLSGAKHHPSPASSGLLSSFSPGPWFSLIFDFLYVAFLDSWLSSQSPEYTLRVALCVAGRQGGRAFLYEFLR